MFKIGEEIQVISTKVRKAIEQRNKDPIQELAVAQVEAGADALEVNIGPQKKKGPEVMEWMVDTIQEVVDVPLCLDTTNLAAMEAGLKRVKQQAIVNSTSADPDRLRDVPPVAAKHNAKLIALTMAKSIPVEADKRVAIAMEHLMPRIMELGIPMDQVLMDPLILTVSGMQEYCPEAIETIRFLKQISDPPPLTLAGLSNVSNGVPKENRSLINSTYAVMLLAAGLDAAIVDARDERLKEWVRIVEERDSSTPVGQLLLSLYDATAAMEDLGVDAVDMQDPEQAAIFKTVQILQNKIIYADGYLQI
ncbi:MAG: dihydropteroate synthase [Anaerolineae bacterium]|nr:dihydropteroate synthase [Anaerolineae bacterium]NIN95922.1 dihydropteroate synthase [Anaerolineae bacterium]NIQ78886.1 dihydropteroate synthase [Anaerolineae bacterium]